jgi:hypothetical protein
MAAALFITRAEPCMELLLIEIRILVGYSLGYGYLHEVNMY